MKIAFIDFIQINNEYRAGILLTDEITKPIEFRTTTDIHIDQLQKILYGDTLEGVLYKENFAVELIKALKQPFDIVLSTHKEILNIRLEIQKPIGILKKYDPFKAVDKYSHKIVCITGKYDPLVITMHPFDEKLVVPTSRTLQDIYKNYNLLEPFSRIKKAIQFLAQNN